jgi:hypothetical protein
MKEGKKLTSLSHATRSHATASAFLLAKHRDDRNPKYNEEQQEDVACISYGRTSPKNILKEIEAYRHSKCCTRTKLS